MQYLCGYPDYDDEKLPFATFLMVYFRKRLTPEVLGEIHKMIVWDADECERVEVERRFRLAKRKCGMGLVVAKLWETAVYVIAMSVLVLNLCKIQCTLFQSLANLWAAFSPERYYAIVQ